MTAATTRKSKPNESRSFPDPSAMRDTVATHLLPHKLCNNPPSSTGFHSACDDSLFLISPDSLHIMCRSVSVHAAPLSWVDPLHTIIWENWYFLGQHMTHWTM